MLWGLIRGSEAKIGSSGAIVGGSGAKIGISRDNIRGSRAAIRPIRGMGARNGAMIEGSEAKVSRS